MLEKHKKIYEKRGKENMTPMRKILELIIYCKKIAEECDKASASHDDQSKRNWKKSRQKKATQRMSDNKPRRL